jgi:hypothetical protein
MKEADTKLTDERYLWLRYAIEDDRERETVAHGQDAA